MTDAEEMALAHDALQFRLPPRATQFQSHDTEATIQFKELIAQQVPPLPRPHRLRVSRQEKCNIAKWRPQPGYLEPESPSPSGAPPPHPPLLVWLESGFTNHD
jgi:hypothetical protein